MDQDEPTDRPASPRARDEARQRGQVVRSPDVIFAMVVAVACGWFAARGPSMWHAWTQQVREAIQQAYRPGITAGQLSVQWQQSLTEGAQWLAPGLVLLMMAAAAGHWLQHGPLWLPQRLVPDVTRLDLAANGLRWWTHCTPTRPLNGLIKTAVVALAVIAWCRAHGGAWAQLARCEPQQLVTEGTHLAGQLAAVVVLSLVTVGAFDFLLRWQRFERSLRISSAGEEADVQAVRNDLRSAGRGTARADRGVPGMGAAPDSATS